MAYLTHRTLRARPHCPLPQKEITEAWPPNADLGAGSDEGCEVGEYGAVVAKEEHRWFVVTSGWGVHAGPRLLLSQPVCGGDGGGDAQADT